MHLHWYIVCNADVLYGTCAGQSKLCRGSVLVVGAGGLGSPALLYLAAAGVGKIGIVDRDEVELSNIHRQVIHREADVGVAKTTSAAEAIKQINSSIDVEEYTDGFTPKNALDIIEKYDVVMDASDNAPTRYLISDACCIAQKPLVSGAAIGTDGQLTVYCYGDAGPCYRCLYPNPPPAQNCARCADAGVLGPVPGAIGTLQALEVIKIISGIGEILSKKMLIVDALYCRYMTVKLRSKSDSCVSCGSNPSVTRDSLPTFDYFAFTGQPSASDAPTSLNLVGPNHRITVAELVERMEKDPMHLVVDVRPRHQFDICSIPGSINAPMQEFGNHIDTIKGMIQQDGDAVPISVICRRGNQSQRALQELHGLGFTHAVDVIGGVQSWSSSIDPSFPLY